MEHFKFNNTEPKETDIYKIPNIDLLQYTYSNKDNIIRIYDLLDTIDFISNKFNVCPGKDFNGNNVYCDLIKEPNILISGNTGTGKSICMHSILASILFETKPDEIKLLLIDPKSVEFNRYTGIPHLLIPVVTDTRKAAGALSWAVSEMMQRYNKLSDINVRDIDGYNAYAKEHEGIEKLPHIVIFVDSLELLMLAAKTEVENAICRLSATARAVGMHLIISTQQEKIIKKANIKTTIKTEIIFDEHSEECYQLLYKQLNTNKPIKIKGFYISENEIDSLCDFIKRQNVTEYSELIQMEAKANPCSRFSYEENKNGYDQLFEEAAEIVIETGQASTSFLQRKLSVGYARGAKIIDQLQEYGVIGSAEGSKPRKILMTKQMWNEKRAYDNNNS